MVISYTGYGIQFDSCSEFSLPKDTVDKNVIIFGVDMGSYVHIRNNKKNILTIGKSLTQGLDDTKLIADAKCYSAILWLNITA